MPSMIVWKCSSRQRELAHDRHQRLRHRMLRRAVERARDLRAPPRELGARDGRVGHFVDDVVDLAAERVERGDRAPPLAAAGTGSCSRSSSRSARPSAGSIRRASCGCVASGARVGTSARYATAPSPACAAPAGARTRRRPPRRSRSRMRMPPAITADSSRPRRHGSARASGRPDCSSARVRARLERASARASGRRRALARSARRSRRSGEVFLRKVDAVLAPVDRDVLPEVGELQSGADRVARARGSSALSRADTARAAGGRRDWPSAGSSRAASA